jgi:hypothetical protein
VYCLCCLYCLPCLLAHPGMVTPMQLVGAWVARKVQQVNAGGAGGQRQQQDGTSSTASTWGLVQLHPCHLAGSSTLMLALGLLAFISTCSQPSSCCAVCCVCAPQAATAALWLWALWWLCGPVTTAAPLPWPAPIPNPPPPPPAECGPCVLSHLPVLLEQGDQEVDAVHDVGPDLCFLHGHVGHSHTQAQHLLQLELDGRLGLIHLCRGGGTRRNGVRERVIEVRDYERKLCRNVRYMMLLSLH